SERTARWGMSQAALQFPPSYKGITGIRESMLNIMEGFEDPSKQQHKVWLNCMGNPLLNWPNKDMWKNRILPNLDLFVAFEIRMTDTTNMADYVLPETVAYERSELITESDSCAVLSEPAIPAQGEAKDSAWIWNQIAERLGIGDQFGMDMDQIQQLKATAGFENKEAILYAEDDKTPVGTAPITYDLLKEKGAVRVAIPDMYVPNDILATDMQVTTTGRIEFYNEGLSEVGPMGDYQTCVVLNDEIRGKYPLQLYVGRHKYFMQGQFTNIPECVLLAKSQFGVALNPIEAEKRHMRDGELVEVFNERGTMRVPLQIRDDIPVGMAHTWYSFDESWYPGTSCPQGIMHAENMKERETEFQKALAPLFESVWQREFGMPQPLVHKAGDTTPEALWDNVCDVRKIDEKRGE
ncbi:MAG: molybdopterin-dependent oxidoreductase, partial [Coriobacteriales bacterium]